MQPPAQPALLLETLERLLAIPSADLPTALTQACDAVASALRADKVDAFLLDPSRASLVALGSSNQPLSALQRKVGLDVLPLANGGRAVEAFQTRSVFRVGRSTEDMGELKGLREVLKVESQVGAPLEVGGRVRGLLMVASQQRDFFTEEDARFVESVARWVGAVAHRAELVEEIAKNAVEQGRRAVAEELVTVLAHDLRNFISPVAGRLALLRGRAELEGREADVHDSDAAVAAVRRLDRMISDMLDVARLDHGMFRLDIAPMNLTAAASEVANALSTPEHAIDVAAAEEVIVAADPARVMQCLENLLSNAVRHSPHDAPVSMRIGTRRTVDGERGYVDVADEGPGIPSEILPKIFERFARGPGSPGLGLGLYLARRIAAAHGGELSVESQPGKGTRFRLELPLA